MERLVSNNMAIEEAYMIYMQHRSCCRYCKEAVMKDIVLYIATYTNKVNIACGVSIERGA
jgi:hypothetical protein